MSNPQYQNFRDEHDGDIPVGIPVEDPSNVSPQFNVHQASQVRFRPRPPANSQQELYPMPNLQLRQPVQPQLNLQPMQNQAQNLPMANQQQQLANYQAPIDYSYPIRTRCPCCQMEVMTVVNNETGNATYMWAGGIFLCCSYFGCCSPCCCIPFLSDRFMDKNHYCSQCGFNILRKHKECLDFA